MKSVSLPHNYMPVPVHVHDINTDSFQPLNLCPVIDTERIRRSSLQSIENYLYGMFNTTIKQMAVLMGKDPNSFTSFDAADYSDSLWSRYFE
jgi:hypothetical protein